MTKMRQLLRDAYTCSRCPKKFGFTISPNDSYFKFPPLIGTTGQADILFVGINPRRSASNHILHDALMTRKRAFADLASNQFNGNPYIHFDSNERHYHDHLEIIRRVYGKNRSFESCAAVTELFLCATEKSHNLPYPESSCADYFLPKVLDIVRPKVIVAVGSRVMSYFKTKPSKHNSSNEIVVTLAGHDFPAVKMPHPGNFKLLPSQRRLAINACVSMLQRHLKEQRSAELVAFVKESRREFEMGHCLPTSTKQIMTQLRS